MKRRTFLLGAAAATLPVPAWADIRRLGFLSSSTTAPDSPLLAALREGLKERGHEEGRTIAIDYRFARSSDELPGMAADLVQKRVEVILAAGSEAVVAAQGATATIPIVMTNSGDAVRGGFVASLDKPGGNITGMTQISPELAGKRIEVLREVFPDMKRVGILWNPEHPNTPITVRETRDAAEHLGLLPLSLETREPDEIEPAIARLAAAQVPGAVVVRDPFTVRNRASIVQALRARRILAVFETPEFLEAGGAMYYGADFADLFRRSAAHVDKILKGARPADLPVEQPTKFTLGINSRAALERGIPIPVTVLARADNVIE